MPRSNAFPVIGLAFALVTAGCGTEPVEGIAAETELQQYLPAEEIGVVLTNTSDATIRYQTCPETWDRKDGDGYKRVEELQSCTRNITSVPAGQSVRVEYTFPDGEPLGLYRVVVPVGLDGLTDEVTTNDFEVYVITGS
ncbi:MAG TPA: hypothetical protein VFS94_02345 [Gemmatimonadales bacterium]|nr:hypothetical protein [Gemmatimonadales bacterium]